MIETSEERCDEVERKILELSAARDHLLAALSGLNQQLTPRSSTTTPRR